jgi:pimeloyl-ACP methyl ester carboxylesterase
MRHALLLFGLVACSPGTVDGTGADGGPRDARAVDATPPTPSGCITDVSTGDHTYTCNGLTVDARIPAQCQAPGCGVILVLHGDTGTGLLMDAHIKMRELGAQHGFVVVAPTGPPFGGSYPGSTWTTAEDTKLVALTNQIADVFRADRSKIHVTGFSRGAFMTWRLLCDHADLFASAAPAGAGFGAGFGETTCFQNSRAPSRKIPLVFLMGRTDVSVGYANMTGIRDGAIANYSATGPDVLVNDLEYTHNRWTGAGGAVIETFDHAYENYPTSEFASAQGHCIPGSTTSPTAPQYAIPCELPNKFVWGEQVMTFFLAHPMP